MSDLVESTRNPALLIRTILELAPVRLNIDLAARPLDQRGLRALWSMHTARATGYWTI